MSARIAGLGIVAAAFAFWIAGCDGGGGGGGLPAEAFSGRVTDTAGEAVAGATVYAVPASLVDWVPITAHEVTSSAIADIDEPLEDLVRLQGDTFQRAATDATGAYALSLPAGTYYVYVAPAAGDALHLPGGSGSRDARDANALAGTGSFDIRVSSRPQSYADGQYIGSMECLVCHAGKTGWKKHAHAIGIHEPGKAAFLQDGPRIVSADADVLAKFEAGTTLHYYDFDGTRGFDKFKVQEGGTPPGTTQFSYRLFKENGTYRAEFINVTGTADPVHGKAFDLDFIYGGVVYKSRLVSQLEGVTTSPVYYVFPPAQWQPEGSTGAPMSDDRTRTPWRDYHSAKFWDSTGKKFKQPALKESFDAQCASCHFTNFTIDAATFESTAVESPGGIPWYLPDQRIEGNLGCEVCHGPGKAHRDAAFTRPGQFIVQPGLLAAEREMTICAQCHSRPQGNDTLGLKKDPPLGPDNKMMPPGTSRAEWLATYTSRPDGAASDFWNDAVHSKSHHQQFSDMLKSKKYRNSRILVACSDCHDLHGEGADTVSPRGLTASIEDNSLCARCHIIDPEKPGGQIHALHELIGDLRADVTFRCVDCHMNPTAKTGAGRPGGSGSGRQYFENDVTAHVFAVPRKDHAGVASFTSSDASKGKAMPIPYTRSCGDCHDLSTVSAKPE